MERQERKRETEVLRDREKRQSRHMEAGRGENGEPSVDALRRWFLWAGVALVFCLVFVLGVAALTSGKNKVEEAVLELDGGPVVELRLNRKGNVLAASGLNKAGTECLKDARLDRVSLEKGMDFLISQYAESGSLEETGAVFLTVRKASEDSRADMGKLAGQAAVYAESALIKRQIGVILYTGVIRMDSDIEELVQKYQISPGKAGLIKDLVDKNTRLKLEDRGRLAGMDTKDIFREMAENKYSTSFTSAVIKTSYVEKEPAASVSGADVETEPAKETGGSESAGESGTFADPDPSSGSSGEKKAAGAKSSAAAAPESTAAAAAPPAETPAPEESAGAKAVPAATPAETPAPSTEAGSETLAAPAATPEETPAPVAEAGPEPPAAPAATSAAAPAPETTAGPESPAGETVMPPVEISQTEPQAGPHTDPESQAEQAAGVSEESASPLINPKGRGFQTGD